MKKSCSVLLALAFGVGLSGAALAADVGGAVKSAQGQPVSGLQVIAKDASGKVVGQATTASNGSYLIKGVNPGSYNFTLAPGSTGFQGQTVASSLGPDGLCLNWGVSSNAPAVATAQPGIACQPAAAAAGGWGTAEYVGAGAGVVGAGAIAAAVTIPGGENNKSPQSPSQ